MEQICCLSIFFLPGVFKIFDLEVKLSQLRPNFWFFAESSCHDLVNLLGFLVLFFVLRIGCGNALVNAILVIAFQGFFENLQIRVRIKYKSDKPANLSDLKT